MQSSRGTEAGEPAPVHEPDRPATADEEPDERDAELARLEDRYKRALADLDNYRKRAGREVDRQVAEARRSMLRDWLEAVDSVERAMQIEPEGPCFEGLRAVLEQMDAVLARQGAVRIGATGDQFDPERHEAVAVRATADHPDRTIVTVERSGFALGDQVVRPAQVVVAQTPAHAR